MLERSYERFRTTSWTHIRALKSPDASQRQEALQSLVERYWPAVYAYLRRQGHSRDSASELTQAFFSDVVVGRSLFGRADECNGRLRTLLLRSLRNFCIDQTRRARTSRTVLTLSITFEVEEAKLESIPCSEGEATFDRRWALSLFEEALRRCETHFRRTGRDSHWELFEQRILTPAVTGNAPAAYTAASCAAAFNTTALAAAAVQVVKRRFISLLREVVAETVENPADVEQEFLNVRNLLCRSRHEGASPPR
jgi:DNA-directed RNA polymerase specialized sigma24 family protein